VETLSSLNDQAAVLAEQLKIAQLKQQIRAADASNSAPNPTPLPGSGSMSYPNLPSAPPAAASNAPALPTILSISGESGRLTALIQLGGGGQVVAYPGMGLPGGMTVYDVSTNGVRVMSAGALVSLPFASAGADAPMASGSAPLGTPAFGIPRIGPTGP
jgi:type IV pilus biogenesis protein PilP